MEKKITPSDLRKQAQELIKSGKMPSVDQLAQAMTEERDVYVPMLRKLREKDEEE